MLGNMNDNMKDNKLYTKKMQKNSSYKKMAMKWQSGLFVKADGGGVIVNLICRCRHLKVQETALVLIPQLVYAVANSQKLIDNSTVKSIT